MTFNEPSFNNKDEAKNFLRRLCGQEIIVHVSDGRRFIGSFWCTDNVGNIVMETFFYDRRPWAAYNES
ncbi:hypothetical protein EWB00_001999 [Schistosoma japonicum]|uniref:LSM domain-containing protein n=1 Tax=Schistosoma japonicum TaxID=6182 RepID=A0A4Z2DDT9_SCHJA|nr:hypothetical protein EWB00_001999 [Schistosoma japonicum]